MLGEMNINIVQAHLKPEVFFIQGVPGGKDLTSRECSLGQTIPI